MTKYPVKLLKDKDGTAFVPVVNSDSIITPEGDTLNDLLEEKQDLLTSGTNIKTINNESLLGSGNISIQGGSGASVWGNITGTLADQTDLYNELSNKVDKSADYGDDTFGMFVNDSLNGIGLSVSDVEGREYGKVNIDTNGVKINGLITPTNNKDAANKEYVDSVIPTKTSDLTNDSGFITSSANKYSLTELKALTDPTDDLFLSLKADIINHNPMVITYSQNLNLNSSTSISAEAVVLSATVETTQDFGEVYAISFRKDIISHPGIIHTLGFMSQGEQLVVLEILMIENEIAIVETPTPTLNLTLSSLETGDIVVCGEIMKIRYSESDEWAPLEGIKPGNIFIKNASRGISDPVGYLATETRKGWYMVYAAVYHKSGDELGYYISELTYYGRNPINPIAYMLKNSIQKDQLMEGPNVSIEDSGSGWLRISANENESYGTCSSSGDASVKVVNVVRGNYLVEGTVGNILRVRFDNALTCNNPTLRVGYGTSFDIYDRDTNNKLQSGAWGAGDIVTFYWDGSAVRAIAGLRATTTNYGETKLSSSVSSTSTTEAATSSAVKAAYDLAASKGTGTITSVKINATSPIAIDNNTAITTSGERTISHATSGVTAGTYKSVTVNATGHVTAGANPTTLSGYGITDAKISNGTITLGSNTITPSTIKNIKDGSATGSVRTSNSSAESTSYTMGQYAFSEGYYTKASGNASHAEGGYTKAFGDNSHAEGYWSEASGKQSHAEGNATVAAGDYSHSEGYYTTANEDYSHSEGYYTTASGHYGAHSEGYNTAAKGSYSHSEGKYTVASKSGSHAEGYWARAVGQSSHAEGGWYSSVPYNIIGTVVSIDTENKTYEVSGLTRYIDSDDNYVGAMYYNSSNGSSDSYYITSETYDTTTNNFTFGVSSIDPSIVVGGSFYIKISSVALGDFSHSEGNNTFAIGRSSHAEGWNTTARYSGSHAEGSNTYAGPFAHAEGDHTQANGNCSHSEGDHTQANGNCSHSEGYYTEANGKYSHSEGIYTKGTGDYSHVEGWGSEASGSYSHAEGAHTIASGKEGSHAEGYATTAAGASSHAEGGFSGYFQQGTVVSVDAENKTYEVSGLPVLYNASGYPIYNGASYSKATSGYFNDNYIIISSTRSNNNYIFTVSGFYTTIAVGDPFYITMGSKAQGSCSHAEGQTCLAIGNGSHAEGNRTIASGSYSHTEGDHTEASGSSSHAGGYFTKANKAYQTAIGKYNQNVNNALLEVGNGTADDARSNAFVVYSDGRAELGADPTTAMGVATKQYVDNLNTYSTGEQRIGTWINNKPIYRKVFTFTTPNDNNDYTITTNISNMMTALNCYGGIIQGNGSLTPIPTAIDFSGVIYTTSVRVYQSNILYRGNAAYGNSSAYVIIEYTKTTD